jgi:hypothetical protein
MKLVHLVLPRRSLREQDIMEVLPEVEELAPYLGLRTILAVMRTSRNPVDVCLTVQVAKAVVEAVEQFASMAQMAQIIRDQLPDQEQEDEDHDQRAGGHYRITVRRSRSFHFER